MIGIFDSGLGGLTAVKEMIKLSPSEELIYFGDTGRVPYGNRSSATITKYACQDAAFLMSKKVDAIVVACGTVSTTSISHLKETLPIPVIGVVEPSAEAAVQVTKNGRIAVIGTAATIRSGAFERAIKELSPECEVITQACPLFVPLVENGFVSDDCEITRLTAEHYLGKIRESGADTLILGCTHYPIIAGVISRVLPSVTLINSGAEAAKKALDILGKRESGNGSVSYYVSDDPTMFVTGASLFLGKEVSGTVEKININEY
jgi:glutamate racemase